MVFAKDSCKSIQNTTYRCGLLRQSEPDFLKIFDNYRISCYNKYQCEL